MTTGERWLPVVGYEGYYEVSNAGRVKSLPRLVRAGFMPPRTYEGRLLGGTRNRGGYPTVFLSKDGVVRSFMVHRLVLGAFIGPCPEGQYARHLNGKTSDSQLENLTYGTQSENLLDKRRHGTDFWANKTHCPQGHEYTPENTLRKDGGDARGCRACGRESARRYRAKKRSESAS